MHRLFGQKREDTAALERDITAAVANPDLHARFKDLEALAIRHYTLRLKKTRSLQTYLLTCTCGITALAGVGVALPLLTVGGVVGMLSIVTGVYLAEIYAPDLKAMRNIRHVLLVERDKLVEALKPQHHLAPEYHQPPYFGTLAFGPKPADDKKINDALKIPPKTPKR
jgi:hypothetical protein